MRPQGQGQHDQSVQVSTRQLRDAGGSLCSSLCRWANVPFTRPSCTPCPWHFARPLLPNPSPVDDPPGVQVRHAPGNVQRDARNLRGQEVWVPSGHAAGDATSRGTAVIPSSCPHSRTLGDHPTSLTDPPGWASWVPWCAPTAAQRTAHGMHMVSPGAVWVTSCTEC